MKIKVVLWEHERGWGSKPFHKEYFDSITEAEKYANDVNSKNTSPTAPDYYIRAEVSIEQ